MLIRVFPGNKKILASNGHGLFEKKSILKMQRRLSHLLRFRDGNNKIQYGQALPDNITHAELLDEEDPLQSSDWTTSGKIEKIGTLLPPVAPTQIIGIGLNYKKHALETKKDIPAYPIIFHKAISSVTSHGACIVLPHCTQQPPEVDYEGELAVVIGRVCKNVSVEEALKYVSGYTIGNDVSARRWQGQKKGGGQWCKAKSFDTFCPLGPTLVHADWIPNPQILDITTTLNGTVVQKSSTADMIFSVAEIIHSLSQGTTLLPGTVILTGTPEVGDISY